ncbi:MAG: hypothetical protein EZS28_032891, partial [Streblomastix strix]
MMKGIRFISQDPEIFTAGDENLYNYILNWIAFVIQNVGVKSEMALILQSIQGIGKNRLTDVLSELVACYSIKNVIDIDEFTGKHNSVVENIILGIANELKNFGEARYSNMNVLKSIITDNQIRINEIWVWEKVDGGHFLEQPSIDENERQRRLLDYYYGIYMNFNVLDLGYF